MAVRFTDMVGSTASALAPDAALGGVLANLSGGIDRQPWADGRGVLESLGVPLHQDDDLWVVGVKAAHIIGGTERSNSLPRLGRPRARERHHLGQGDVSVLVGVLGGSFGVVGHDPTLCDSDSRHFRAATKGQH